MLTIQSSDFKAAADAARSADKAIIRELRRGLRKAGEGAAGDVRDAIGQIPSSGRFSTGVRAALAAGTRVSISTASPRTAGVRIVTDPRRLPAKRRILGKALNLAEFRHPVFADQRRGRSEWTWVAQQGRPYFGGVILARKSQMESDLWRALKVAEHEVMKKQQEAGSDVS